MGVLTVCIRGRASSDFASAEEQGRQTSAGPSGFHQHAKAGVGLVTDSRQAATQRDEEGNQCFPFGSLLVFSLSQHLAAPQGEEGTSVATKVASSRERTML